MYGMGYRGWFLFWGEWRLDVVVYAGAPAYLALAQTEDV
jgi:hypothetical protein